MASKGGTIGKYLNYITLKLKTKAKLIEAG